MATFKPQPPPGPPPPDKRIRFDPVVRVAMLPSEQRLDARRARKGLWKPGPPHDELWDGDILDFRDQELSAEEFKQLMKKYSSKRTSLPKTLARFQRLFAVATEKISIPGKGGFPSGIDIVGARARLSQDFEEEDREESVPNKERDESSNVSKKESDDGNRSLSDAAARKSNGVRVSYFDFNEATPPVRSPGNSPTHRPGVKTTRFDPSPPSDPSPSERSAMLAAASVHFIDQGGDSRNSQEYDVPLTGGESRPVSIEGVSLIAAQAPLSSEAIRRASEAATSRRQSASGIDPAKIRTITIDHNDVRIQLAAALFAVFLVHVFIFRITLLRVLGLAVVAFVSFVVYTSHFSKQTPSAKAT